MRPMLLSLTAFGPYRNEEQIDFRQLGHHRLFVISGSTGAGKTTIFDAVCFALYGTASGEDRADARMLRSDFAPEDIHTSVDFTFAVASKTYRVFRQLGHRKGNNKSETGSKVELYEKIGEKEIPCVDRFTVSDVNARLESIIGLTKEQFSQIVMLPQGEFRKLLTSDTENKEEILRRIFRTTLYRQLEERFQHMVRERKERHKEAQAALQLQMTQAGEMLPQREESTLAQIWQQPEWNAHQVMAGLAEEIAYYGVLESDSVRVKDELASQLEKLEEKLRAGLLLNNRLEELGKLHQRLVALNDQKADMQELERVWRLAEQAARLEPYEEQAMRAEQLSLSKQQEMMQHGTVLASLKGQLEIVRNLYREEEAREPERKAAEAKLRQLEDWVPAVQALDEKKREVRELEANLLQAKDAMDRSEKQWVALREQRQQLALQLQLLDQAMSALPTKLAALERMRNKARLLKELMQLEKQMNTFESEEKKLKQQLTAVREEHDQLETGWIEGQASLLASHLHEGEPCPVCGSETHPNIAQAHHTVPSREALQKAKEQLAAIEQVFATAKAEVAAARNSWMTKEKDMLEFGIKPWDLDQQMAVVEREGIQLRDETKALQEQVDQRTELHNRNDKLESEIDEVQRHKEQLQQRTHTLQMELGAKQSLLMNELERIPEQVRSPEQLQAHMQEQARHNDQLQQAWKHAQQNREQLETRHAAEEANEAQLRKQAADARTALQEALERFHGELTKAGFADKAAYAEVMLPEEERQSLRERLDHFAQTYATVRKQHEMLQQELGNQQPPDLASLQQAIEQAKAELEQALTAVQNAARYKTDAVRLQSSIGTKEHALQKIESDLQQVMDIHNMLRGDNALKISFERYILIEYLEQILQAANLRLQQLSNGQFLLQRSNRLEARGRQSGLGLDVYDAYTGQNRDVKTLSGGEKFHASLSLALGMTDVIQANQGGVSIEMMLIDEGFGSLDEESLNKAIGALADLQRSGRMIGVISHVSELKQAFPAVLEVIKTKEGYSRTAFLIK